MRCASCDAYKYDADTRTQNANSDLFKKLYGKDAQIEALAGRLSAAEKELADTEKELMILRSRLEGAEKDLKDCQRVDTEIITRAFVLAGSLRPGMILSQDDMDFGRNEFSRMQDDIANMLAQRIAALYKTEHAEKDLNDVEMEERAIRRMPDVLL